MFGLLLTANSWSVLHAVVQPSNIHAEPIKTCSKINNKKKNEKHTRELWSDWWKKTFIYKTLLFYPWKTDAVYKNMLTLNFLFAFLQRNTEIRRRHDSHTRSIIINTSSSMSAGHVTQKGTAETTNFPLAGGNFQSKRFTMELRSTPSK